MASQAPSYASTLKANLAHALVKLTTEEGRTLVEKLRRHERVEPELVVAATHLGQHAALHPMKAMEGEQLPEGLERSSVGILVNKKAIRVSLDKDKIAKEMEQLQKKVVIAYFVGGCVVSSVLQKWVIALSSEINEVSKIGRDLGHGFFQVVMKEEAAMQKVLMLTPHLSKWGTCIMQLWMLAFVASKPQGMRMLVWLTLKNVPEEFLSSTQEMAGSLGTVLGHHRRNAVCADQKFCVAVKTRVPFDMALEAVNPVNGETTLIQVDYNNLPIRCRYCLSTSHLVKNCPSIAGQRRPQRSVNPAKPWASKLAASDKGKALEVNAGKNVTSKPGREVVVVETGRRCQEKRSAKRVVPSGDSRKEQDSQRRISHRLLAKMGRWWQGRARTKAAWEALQAPASTNY